MKLIERCLQVSQIVKIDIGVQIITGHVTFKTAYRLWKNRRKRPLRLDTCKNWWTKRGSDENMHTKWEIWRFFNHFSFLLKVTQATKSFVLCIRTSVPLTLTTFEIYRYLLHEFHFNVPSEKNKCFVDWLTLKTV